MRLLLWTTLLCGLQCCSRQLNWHDIVLACDGLRCREGFSCLTLGASPGCVADASLGLAQPCLASQQCMADLACLDFACRKPCRGMPPQFYAADACDGAQVCRPLWQGSPQAACGPADPCLVGAACATPEVSQGGICVGIGRDARACLRACTAEGKACADNERCLPVGLPQAGAQVCVPRQDEEASNPHR